MDGYLIEITDPHYTAGIRDYVAVPEQDGDEFRLWTVEGDLVAEARKDPISGRYLSLADDELILYREWPEALAAGTGGRFTAREIRRIEIT